MGDISSFRSKFPEAGTRYHVSGSGRTAGVMRTGGEGPPTAKDAILAIEIADSSVAYARKGKAPLSARHEIREYWLLDLPAKILEVYRRPGPDGYREVRRLRRGDSIAPEAFPEVVFAVSDLL